MCVCSGRGVPQPGPSPRQGGGYPSQVSVLDWGNPQPGLDGDTPHQGLDRGPPSGTGGGYPPPGTVMLGQEVMDVSAGESGIM